MSFLVGEQLGCDLDALGRLVTVQKVPHRALIITAAGTGLRPGSRSGLTVDRVEFLRRTVKVDRQLVRFRGRGVELGPVKTPRSYRTVPLPDVVADALAEHVRLFPKQRHARRGESSRVHERTACTGRAAPLRIGLRYIPQACAACRSGPPRMTSGTTTPSPLIRSARSVKAVQARLGHASAKTTLTSMATSGPTTRTALERLSTRELATAAEDRLRTAAPG